MEVTCLLMSLLTLLLSAACILLVAACILGDADLSTLLWERWGTSLDKGLKDKVVWVTGASTGIGAALAVEAARHGAIIVITARRGDLLEKVKEQCVAVGAPPDKVLVLPLDLCDYSAHAGAFQKVLDYFGHLDILINNAGRSQRARWEHTDIKVRLVVFNLFMTIFSILSKLMPSSEVDESLFSLNVFSVVSLTRVVLPHMLERGSGSVSVMSSSAGKAGVPYSGTYTG